MSIGRDGFGREQRHHPIRRLTKAECDQLEYEGPLVLCQQQIKWMIGPWRPMNFYVVAHHTRGVMWEGNKKEWLATGIPLEPPSE